MFLFAAAEKASWFYISSYMITFLSATPFSRVGICKLDVLFFFLQLWVSGSAYAPQLILWGLEVKSQTNLSVDLGGC